jgi:hypothetical protein
LASATVESFRTAATAANAILLNMFCPSQR